MSPITHMVALNSLLYNVFDSCLILSLYIDCKLPEGRSQDFTFSLWQPTPVFLPGEPHGWRSLVGYSPRSRKESDKTERRHFHFHRRALGFPGGASGTEPTCQCMRHKRRGFNPWVRKIPWRRAWQPTTAFLPGESHGQRSLVGYSP